MTRFALITPTPLRGHARRNAERTLAAEPVIAAAFCGFLALVCLKRGLEPLGIWKQLARRGRGRNTFAGNRAWRQASEARAIAIYLVNTIANVPGSLIASSIDVDASTVCLALRRVEHKRDDVAFDSELDQLAWMATGYRQ